MRSWSILLACSFLAACSSSQNAAPAVHRWTKAQEQTMAAHLRELKAAHPDSPVFAAMAEWLSLRCQLDATACR